MCFNGCPRRPWNGKTGEFCCKACRDGLWCKRVGCMNATWNGKSGEYCSMSCRRYDGYSAPIHIQEVSRCVIGFYFPGEQSSVDKVCRAEYLANFYEGPFPVVMTIRGISYNFRTAEGAYQGLKFPDHIGKFTTLTGSDAFNYKRKLEVQGVRRDSTFHGFGSSWNAMWHVLKAKFEDPKMGTLLCQTDDAFLLEHCDRTGRDKIWSDNNNGTGTNWLGLLLMYLRNELQGQPISHGLKNLGLTHTQGPTNTNAMWMSLVKRNSDTIRMALR